MLTWAKGRPVTAIALILAAGVVVVGAILRIAGLDWGNPYVYHPDEFHIGKEAMTMVRTGDIQPHAFLYPSFLIDLEAIAVAVLHSLRDWPLTVDHPWLLDSEFLETQFPYVLAGRAIVAASGIATVVVVIELGRRLAGWTAGLTAGLAMAVVPLGVTYAHYLTTDVPTALLCASCGLSTVLAARSEQRRWWLLAGLLGGLAASTKWNGLSVIGVPLLALLLSLLDRRPGRLGRFWRDTAVLAFGACLGLLVATPALVRTPGEVAESLAFQFASYSQTDPRYSGSSMAFHIGALLTAYGPALIILAVGMLGGIRRALRTNDRLVLVIPAFAIAYLVVASIPVRHYERNLLPLVPYLAVGIGIGAAEFRQWLRTVGLSRPVTTAIVGGAVVLALLPASLASARAATGFVGPDTRTVAREWILDNIPRGTTIARELDAPQFSPAEYHWDKTLWLSERTLTELREAGVLYLLTSSDTYSRFLAKPPEDVARNWYERLFTLPEVYRIDPSPDQRGPTVRVFRLDPEGPLPPQPAAIGRRRSRPARTRRDW